MKLEESEIRTFLADIYKTACLDIACDMKEVAELFENLAVTFLKFPVLSGWKKIKLNRQRFDKSPYIDLLFEFRRQLLATYNRKANELIARETAAFPTRGFGKWLEIYSDALANFEWEVVFNLCNTEFDFNETEQEKIRKFKELNALALDNKWADTVEIFIELSENDDIPAITRCHFSIYVAQIMIYHFGYGDKALEWANKALELNSENILNERFLGEYALINKNLVDARNHFLNTISMDNNHVEAYAFMGDTFLDERKFHTAEEWQHDALNINFLDLIPYSRLIFLLGEEGNFEERKADFESLENKAIHLANSLGEEHQLYNLYKDLGFAYSKSEIKHPISKHYYELAINLRPHQTSAQIDLAYVQAFAKKYEEAENLFMQTLKADCFGKFFDSFWGLGWLYEQQGEFEKAIRFYEQCLGMRKYGEDRVYNVIGIQYINLENYEKAIENYQKAIQIYPSHPVYFDNLKSAILQSSDLTKLADFYPHLIGSFPKNHGYLNDAGVYFHEQGDFHKAAELYSQAIALENSNQVYLKNRALAYQKLGRFEESEVDYLTALKLGEDAAIYNSLGLLQYYQDKNEEAINYYSKAIALNNTSAVYWENRAIAYEKIQYYEEAINDYLKVLEFIEDAFVLNAIGRIKYWKNDFQSALAYYSKALSVSNQHAIIWENRGAAYEKVGNYELAENDLLKAIELDENDFRQNYLGFIYHEKGEFHKAIACYNIAIELNPNDPIYYANRGLSYQQLQEYENAEKDYLKVLEFGTNLRATNALGVIYSFMESHQKAIECYTQAIAIDPNHAIIWENRALSWEKLNVFEQALEDWSMALKMEETPLRYNNIGLLYFKFGNHHQAVQYYTKAIEMNAKEPVFYENRAISYEILEEYDQGLLDCKTALVLQESASLYNLMGLIYFRKKMFQQAIENYSKAIEISPERFVYWENRALAYESILLMEEAAMDYKQLLEFGEDAFYLNRLGEIEMYLGNFTKATHYFNKAIDMDPANEMFLTNLRKALEDNSDERLQN